MGAPRKTFYLDGDPRPQRAGAPFARAEADWNRRRLADLADGDVVSFGQDEDRQARLKHQSAVEPPAGIEITAYIGEGARRVSVIFPAAPSSRAFPMRADDGGEITMVVRHAMPRGILVRIENEARALLEPPTSEAKGDDWITALAPEEREARDAIGYGIEGLYTRERLGAIELWSIDGRYARELLRMIELIERRVEALRPAGDSVWDEHMQEIIDAVAFVTMTATQRRLGVYEKAKRGEKTAEQRKKETPRYIVTAIPEIVRRLGTDARVEGPSLVLPDGRRLEPRGGFQNALHSYLAAGGSGGPLEAIATLDEVVQSVIETSQLLADRDKSFREYLLEVPGSEERILDVGRNRALIKEARRYGADVPTAPGAKWLLDNHQEFDLTLPSVPTRKDDRAFARWCDEKNGLVSKPALKSKVKNDLVLKGLVHPPL